jgi:hypothetical protein
LVSGNLERGGARCRHRWWLRVIVLQGLEAGAVDLPPSGF